MFASRPMRFPLWYWGMRSYRGCQWARAYGAVRPSILQVVFPSSLHCFLTRITGGAFVQVLGLTYTVTEVCQVQLLFDVLRFVQSQICYCYRTQRVYLTTLMKCTKRHSHTHIFVLDDIMQWVGESISAQADTMSCLFGPGGAGKTTIANIYTWHPCLYKGRNRAGSDPLRKKHSRLDNALFWSILVCKTILNSAAEG